METSKAERDELRRLCEAATQGPWKYNGVDGIDQLTDSGKGYPLDLYPDSKVVVAGIAEEFADVRGIIRDEDGDLIAAARNALPALLDEADARDAEIAGLRSQVREAQRERDENRVTLNAIANDLRVVHEDPKILAAFRKIHSERGELRACLRIAIDGFDRGAPMNSTDYKRIRAALGETEPT
jgi:hypothetical protein